jgi:hypothetical protein
VLTVPTQYLVASSLGGQHRYQVQTQDILLVLQGQVVVSCWTR